MIKLKHLLLLLLSFCGTAASAYDFESGGIYYNIVSDTYMNNEVTYVEVTYKDSNYNSYSGHIEIPAKVSKDGKDYNVYIVGNSAFQECSELEFVVIPNSVTYIDDYAFSGCSSLREITLGQNMRAIGKWAFSGCSDLESVIIPNSVEQKGKLTFA